MWKTKPSIILASLPPIYAHYIGDILAKSLEEINKLKEIFENDSVLNFIYEPNINNKITFHVDANSHNLITSLYKKNPKQKLEFN